MATISKLATSQYLTNKHWEWRDGSQIKYIIPHHMAGVMTGAGCANYFVNNGLENSANYCIGYNGDISCNVTEEYGPWTSSFSKADKYGITIEVSNSSNTSSDWPISDNAKDALIRLMVDLFQRYPSLGGKAVFDPADEKTVVAARAAYADIHCNGNILLHNWTDPGRKNCPGPYMTRNMPAICAEVNRRLGGKTTRTLHEEAQYMIDHDINGQARKNQAKADGFDPDKVQTEIDKMLAKDVPGNAEVCAQHLPAIWTGSNGDIVTVLQEILHHMGYYDGYIDGDFGGMTADAVKAFQKNIAKVYGDMVVDGICGPKTWTRILAGK